MDRAYERLQACLEVFHNKISFRPKAALVLGSGLGHYGERIRVESVLNYSDIPGFPVSTVTGHEGRFLFGYVGDVPVAAMQGRVHYYEGYSMEDVVLPIRLMKGMGAEFLLLSNAAGGINEAFKPGDLMLITDQISSFVPSPLIGRNMDELGPRFPDMSYIYDGEWIQMLKDTAKRLGIDLKEGTYVQLSGPQYESPAEIRMLRSLGADAVGMSTACEAVAARHMGMRICGLSCISNMAAGIVDQPLNHEEVQAMGVKVENIFEELVTEAILHIGEM